jgi:hypothetical protein
MVGSGAVPTLFPSKMTRTPQSADDLTAHLSEQLGFLRRSANAYDEGYTDEAKRLATTIRVLVHDTVSSTSLLQQLNEKTRAFHDTAIPGVPGNLATYGALVQMALGPNGDVYVPFLDGPFPSGWTPVGVAFDKWWRRIVFTNPERLAMSRKDLVLAVANQDGGAHIDPSLSEAYAALSRQNAMGWVFEKEGAHFVVRPAELAAVRQIAHELLKTFDPALQVKPRHPDGTLLLMGPSVIMSGTREEIEQAQQQSIQDRRSEK